MNLCDGCKLKQGCFVKEFFRKKRQRLIECPCMNCLVKVTCQTVCLDKFNDLRSFIVEDEAILVELSKEKK
jgi:hypothetical protein